MNPRENGYYWVSTFGDDELEVAHWDGDNWDFCGAESIGYAEPDDPTEKRVRVASERLQPPVTGNAPGDAATAEMDAVADEEDG